MILWGDPKTGQPVRLEMTMPTAPNVTTTMSDFAFNVDLDESLFSVEPPAGYEVIHGPTTDVSAKEEKGPDRHVPPLQQIDRWALPGQARLGDNLPGP